MLKTSLHLFTHVRNDGVKAMSRGLSDRKQLIERGACSAGETCLFRPHKIQLF